MIDGTEPDAADPNEWAGALDFDLDAACPPDRAFTVWSERISDRRPLDHTVCDEPGLTVTLEPRGRLGTAAAGLRDRDRAGRARLPSHLAAARTANRA
jgi:hypothetical protein